MESCPEKGGRVLVCVGSRSRNGFTWTNAEGAASVGECQDSPGCAESDSSMH